MSYDRERKGERQIGVLGRKEKWIELVEEKISEIKCEKEQRRQTDGESKQNRERGRRRREERKRESNN